jgi:predicted NBD/HSP70 family sugar kinase
LRDILQASLHIPVYIDNDVNTLTLAERWFGSGQGEENFLVVTIGRGVGLGIVVNGQFYRGSTGGAGEFGHTLVDSNGPKCECGKAGCLEAYISDPALVRETNEAAGRGEVSRAVTCPEEVVELANEGDLGAQHIFAHAGSILGSSVADLINLFDPALIILGGEGTRAGEWLYTSMRKAITAQVMPGLQNDTRLCLEPWGDDAWARGAASLVLRDLFESPVHKEVAQ